jgi:5-hydroxyisourate hydrolase
MTITAHALDGVYGRSVASLPARLERDEEGVWQFVGDAETDVEGRIHDWTGKPVSRGLYRIVFDSDHYFVALGLRAAYPEITVQVRINGEFDACGIEPMLAPHTYYTYYTTIE